MKNAEQSTVLIVDDTPENLRMLNMVLEEAGFRVLVMQGGEEALQQVEDVFPDIILLDVLMPGIDGFETCRRLKEHDSARDIPVIFLTAFSDIEDKMKGFDLGGVDYLPKPFQIEEVLARINVHLTIRKLQQQLQVQNARLQENNVRLQQEISRRKRVEEERRKHRNHLEELVKDRTTELATANEQLRQEIIERRHIENVARESEQQYRALAENVADGVVIFQERSLVFVNKALVSILGYPLEQLLQIDPIDLFRGDYKERIRKRIERIEKGIASEPYWQVPCVTGDGREIWVKTRQRFIEWEGKPGILVTVRDITERKLREMSAEGKRAQLEWENIALRSSIQDHYKFHEIIGKSPVMQNVYELILKAAASDANVVIFGESGTGKELVAWTIHEMSKRHDKPFVPVNCGAIPESLVERELFGHLKGAFTGAYKDQPGFFRAAERGTLFLDEVGDLPPAMQVKFLRAIADGGYTPVGDHTIRKTDVRIIAATNKNLVEQVKNGSMREDFYYRINVILITLPPLRDRKEDIPLLIDHFLKQFGMDTRQPVLSGRIFKELYDYDWPGNVRELQNVLQRYLTTKCLDFIAPLTVEPVKTSDVSGAALDREGLRFREAVEAFEKQFILRVLDQNHWHRVKTAAMLNISRRSLLRKMEKYGLI